MTGDQPPNRLERLVRFLTMALKERCEAFGIRPDRQGWVSLMDLMGAILDEPDFSWVTVKDVEEAVGSARPPAFEIAGTRIRCKGAPRGAGAGGPAQPAGKSKRRRRRRKPRSGEKPGQPQKTAEKRASGDQPKKKKRRRRRKKKPQPGQHHTQ